MHQYTASIRFIFKEYTCCFLLLLALGGCGGSSSSSAPPPGAAAGTIVVTRTGSPTITTVTGGSQSVAITFNAQDTNSIDQLSVSDGLASLPAGWQGPATFSCESIGTGSGCVLNLTYAPSAVGDGTLALSYTYRDASIDATGSISIPYEATTNNNAVAAVTPAGQIIAVVSESPQVVDVTFTSDDGNPISDVVLTSSLEDLPVEWSSSATSFTCTQASTGNGCQLQLSYGPSTVGSGTLELAYSYLDNAGDARTGTLAVAYAATADNSVIATAAPSGPIAVALGAKQAVAVTFTTNDGNLASQVNVTNLNSMPDGWSSASDDFRCDSVSTGNGCQLQLEFEPNQAGSGVLSLQYAFMDNAGSMDNGTFNLAFIATSHNSVVATTSPTGQIATTVGGSQHVTVTFTTDDANSATQFAITDDLQALPAGWSAVASSLSCPTVSSTAACQLELDYEPSAIGSGTLSLGYSYLNNSGTAQTGTLNVPYVATANNNAVATLAPSGPVESLLGDTQDVTVTFTSDDGNIVTNLQVTSDLTSLEAPWSTGDTSFECAQASSGDACQLSLTFAPAAEGSGTLAINYSYVNHAGIARTGTVSIPYAAYGPQLFVPQTTLVDRCRILPDGSFTDCASSATDLAFPIGMVFVDNRVYLANFSANNLSLCNVEASGAFTGCVTTGQDLPNPLTLAHHDGVLYTVRGISRTLIYACPIDADGLVSFDSCIAVSTPTSGTEALAVGYGALYRAAASFGVFRCPLLPDGSFSDAACSSQGSGYNSASGIVFSNDRAYVADGGDDSLTVCDVNSLDGSFSGCTKHTLGVVDMRQVAVHNDTVYLTSGVGGIPDSAQVYYCALDAMGRPTLGCSAGDGTFTNPVQLQVR